MTTEAARKLIAEAERRLRDAIDRKDWITVQNLAHALALLGEATK